MTHEQFVDDWKQRYVNKTCTQEHLERLVKIGKINEDEYKKILLHKRKLEKGVI